MKIRAIALAILVLAGCSWFRPSWVSETSIPVEERADNAKVPGVDGPTGGHFDKEGNWIPDNKEIPLTYKIPDISGGFIFDFATMDLTPVLTIEIFEIDSGLPYIRTIKFDGGIGYQRAFLYIGKLWTNIFEISTGGFIGWNWEDNIFSWGLGVTVIEF